MLKGISLFSGVGIAETYFKEKGIDIKVANEIIPTRCKFYSHLYPNVNMVCGDISREDIFKKLVGLYKKFKCNFLIATPPCQGMSVAGKMDINDPRNSLIIYIIEFIKQTKPQNIIIENVPQMLKFFINIDNKSVKIVDYIESNLKPLGYFINYSVLDASNYNTAQYRKRAIFLISKEANWVFPNVNPILTTRELIGSLPSLESGEKSNIKYHYSKKHNSNHILWMKNTATGKTAFDNLIYYPNKNGRKIKGFSTTYKRIEWDKPAPTITMCNGAISSQNNVHPGYLLEDGTYSDARVLTILELLRLTGLPDDWNIPSWASENLIRQVIGEGFPPKFALALLETIKFKETYDNNFKNDKKNSKANVDIQAKQLCMH